MRAASHEVFLAGDVLGAPEPLPAQFSTKLEEIPHDEPRGRTEWSRADRSSARPRALMRP